MDNLFRDALISLLDIDILNIYEAKNCLKQFLLEIIRFQKLPESKLRSLLFSFTEEHWNYISSYQTLSEDFIREFQDKVYWVCISAYQKLSEDFIREFQYKVCWYNISMYQKLSESFINEFENRINWYVLSYNIELSDELIRRYYKKLDFNLLFKNPNISNEIKETIRLLSS